MQKEIMVVDHAKLENDHRARMLEIVATVQEGLPQKWEKVGAYAIGGLTSVGFSSNEQFLLVVSSQGRGVFDCFSGKKIARDNEAEGDWFDEKNLTCEGIGPIAGETIPVAGLEGGGLRRWNSEGDILDCISPYWPIKEVILCPKWKNVYGADTAPMCHRIWRGYELRAFGFSPSGLTFVISESSDITIYTLR